MSADKTNIGNRRHLWRSRWAAIGAAVAVTFGGGGLLAVQAASGPASSVVTVTPERILDTRSGVGLSGPFVSGVSRKLQVTGAVVPAGATGVLLNVTVVAPTAAGFLSVRPGDATGVPSTSSLNFTAGDIVPNSVQVALPTSGANAGQIDVTFDAFGAVGPTTNVLADVVGYLLAGGPGTPGATSPAGAVGATGPAGSAGATGSAGANGPVPGTACTAGGVSGAVTSGFNLTGVFAVHCFRNEVSTLAGNTQGFVDGPGTAARFDNPFGVAVDGSGNVYVADPFNDRIRKITAAGVVSTLAGNGTSGLVDGAGTVAQFRGPAGVAVDGSGNVYVADSGNNAIRKITAAGVVSTLAGNGTLGLVDAAGTAARFRTPVGVAVDGSGNVYVADMNNNSIRMITAAGVVSTLAGAGFFGAGFVDAAGINARFRFPQGVAVDGSGNVYVADTDNMLIRKITAGVVSTLAGGNQMQGLVDAAGTAARFRFPQGVAVDGSGNVYVADISNHSLRKVTAAGVVSTVAGNGTQGFVDGPGTTARFNNLRGVAVDGSGGNIYVVDASNHRIRQIR